MAMVRPGFWRDLWALMHPYWRAKEQTSVTPSFWGFTLGTFRVREKLVAWALLIGVVGLTLAMVYMEVLFNEWNNAFYNSLQDKDKAAFFKLMGRFSMLAAIYIVLYIYNVYLNQWLQIRWRRWMTDKYLGEWLGNRSLLPDATDREPNGQPGPADRRRSQAVRRRDAQPRAGRAERSGHARLVRGDPVDAVGYLRIYSRRSDLRCPWLHGLGCARIRRRRHVADT